VSRFGAQQNIRKRLSRSGYDLGSYEAGRALLVTSSVAFFPRQGNGARQVISKQFSDEALR
jgi:hypothetical protein